MTLTVDQATSKIHDLVNDQGFLGTDRNDHMHQVQDVLKQFSAGDEDKIVSKLSSDDLGKLAGNVNSGGIFGAQGLSGGEKKDLFNNFAQTLDGTQLGRMAKAFSDRGDVTALGDSVATFGSSQAKVDFVKAIAGDATSGDSKLDAGFGYTSLHTGDKEALAANQVLSSLKNDPAAFNTAINALSKDQLAAVVKAGEGETMTTYAGMDGAPAMPSTTYDPSGLRSLLDAASASGDASVKAKVFEAASKAIGDIRGSDGLLTPNPGAGDSAKSVADGMTKLLNTDTRGIVDRLDTDDLNGKALTNYLQEVIRENPAATNPALGQQIAQLQGAGTGQTASQFTNAAENGPNGDHFYRNAENLGYYAGAMEAAINKMNADTKTKGDILTNVFTTAVSAGAAAIPGLSVPGKVGAQVFNGLTREAVREVVSDVTSGRKDLREALTELTLPRDKGQTDRTRGPADPYYESSANTVVLANQ